MSDLAPNQPRSSQEHGAFDVETPAMSTDFLTPAESALFTSDEATSIAVWSLCESYGMWQDGYDLERAASEHVRPEVREQAIATVRRLVAHAHEVNAARSAA